MAFGFDDWQARNAGPAGLQQQTGSPATQGSAVPEDPAAAPGATKNQFGFDDWSQNQPRWQTGGNSGSTQNGWDTPFYRTFFQQVDEETAKGASGDLYGRSDFTGIVLQNENTGGKKLGDVYQNGKRVGNLYSSYDRDTAEQILFPLMAGDAREQQDVYGRLQSDPDAVHAAIQAKVDAVDEAARGYLTQKAYADSVQQKAQEIGGDTGAQVGNVAAGVAGGAATGGGLGALIGSIVPVFGTAIGAGVGAAVGGLVGGIGSWLNRDEAARQQATAIVQTEMAGEQAGARGTITTGLQQWGSVASKYLSPLANTVRGIYDQTHGGADGDVAWYDVDDQGRPVRNAAWYLGEKAFGLVDFAGVGAGGAVKAGVSGLGLVAARAAGTAYGVTMEASALGNVGQLAVAGGMRFDDTTGQFESVYDNGVGSTLAAYGSAGIDVAQGLLPNFLGRAARGELSAATSATRGETVELSGRVFKFDEAGRLANQRISAASFVAPSEMVSAMSTRVLAMRMAAKDGRTALVADDIYQAASTLARGGRKLTNALVNGFGEGSEELIQGVLDPISTRNKVNAQDVADQALTGFVMGAGMGIGASSQGARQADYEYGQHVVGTLLRGGTPLERAAFDKLTPQQRADQAAPLPPLAEAQAKAAADKLVTSQKISEVASVTMLDAKADALQAFTAKELERISSSVDAGFVIGSLASTLAPNHAAVFSLQQAANVLQRSAQGFAQKLAEATRSGADAATVARLQGESDQAAQLAQLGQEATAAYEQVRDDQARRNDVVDRFNRAMQQAWDAQPAVDTTGAALTTEQLGHRRRAASILFTRYPQDQSGSYLPLMVQASREYTADGANNAMAVSQAILQQIGGDHDGDKMFTQALLDVTPDRFAALRAGMNLLGATNGVNIATRKREEVQLHELNRALTELPAGDPVQLAAADAIDRIFRALLDRYADTVVPRADLLDLFGRLDMSSPSLRADLLDGLRRDFGSAISRRGIETFTNEWLWVDDTFHAALQQFSTAYAMNLTHPEDATLRADLRRSEVIPQSTNVFTRRYQAAVTDGFTLGIVTEGDSLFRKFQKLHYSGWLASVLGAQSRVEEMSFAELSQFYELLANGTTQSAVDALRANDEVAARTLNQLEQIASNSDRTYRGSVALVANTLVPDVDPETGEFGGQLITMAQSLLKRNIAWARSQTVAPTEQQTQAWNALEALTRPGRDADAFVEVLGGIQLSEVVGSESVMIGANLTVEQTVRNLRGMNEQVRSRQIRRMKTAPAYGREITEGAPFTIDQSLSGQFTDYRVLVDMVAKAANSSLSVDDSGLSTGTLGDSEGGRSFRTSRQLAESFTQIRQAFNLLGRSYRGLDVNNPEHVNRVLDEHPEFARAFMGLFPENIRNVVFGEIQQGANRGRFGAAKWVYEILRDDAAHTVDWAVMHYWRNLLLAQWHARSAGHLTDDVDSAYLLSTLDNTFHRLMVQLHSDNPDRLVQFVNDMQQATSLDDFMRLVNTEYRTSQAPFVAWVTDASEFSADVEGSGLLVQRDSGVLRDAIGVLNQRAGQLVKSITEEKAADAADTALMSQLVLDLQLGRKSDELSQFRKAVQHAADRARLLGPAAMQDLTTQSLIHFFAGDAHTKGKSPDAQNRIGEFQAISEDPGFLTNPERHEAALTAVDASDLASNMEVAAKGALNLTDDDGRPFTWDQVTAESLLSMWSNKAARPAIRAFLFPSVWEKTPQGLTQQFLTGKSIGELIGGEYYAGLLVDKHAPSMLYLSQLDSLAGQYGGTFDLMQLANDIVIAQSSSKGQKYTQATAAREVQKVYRELARVFRMVGEIRADEIRQVNETGSPVTNASGLAGIFDTIYQEHVTQQLVRRFGVSAQDVRGGVTDALLDDFKLRADSDFEASTRLVDQDDTLSVSEKQRRIDMLQEDHDSTTALLDSIRSGNLLQPTIERYRLDGKTADEVKATKAAIVQYVRLNGDLATKAPWAQDVLRYVTRDLLATTDPTYLPEHLTAKQWDTLSRAVISAHIDALVDPVGANVAVFEMPAFTTRNGEPNPLVDYMDASYRYLLKKLLDPASPLVRAAAEIHTRAGRTVATVGLTDLQDLITSTVFNAENYGVWTPDVLRVTIESRERLQAAAAEMAVQQAGISPVNQIAESMATRRPDHHVAPPEDTVSSLQVSGEKLFGIDLAPFDVDIHLAGGATGRAQMSAEQLNGRAVRSVTLTYKGAPVQIDGQDNLLYFPGAEPYVDFLGDENVLNSGWKFVTTERLRSAIDRAMQRFAGLSTDDTDFDWRQVGVTIEYLHPDSQPLGAEHFNSAFYEGLSFEETGDVSESLNETLWFVNGALSPRLQAQALQANKKGTWALVTSRVLGARAAARFSDQWKTDLARVMADKARYLVTEDLGGGALGATYFNASYKRMKMRHWVRGTDLATGQPRLWTAEEIVAWQRANPGQSLDTIIGGAELYMPSARTLRSMLGEQNARGLVTLTGQPVVDSTKIPRFTGDAAAVVARVPGILEVRDGTLTHGDLFQTRAAARAFQSQLSTKPVVDERVNTAFERAWQLLEARRQEIVADRLRYSTAEQTTERNRRGLDYLNAALKTTVQTVDLASFGLPTSSPRAAVNTQVAEYYAQQLQSELQSTDDLRAVWTYVYEGGRSTAVQGELNRITLRDAPARQLAVARNDVIVVNLASFARNGLSNDEQIKLAQAELRQMVDLGATIVLVDGGPDGVRGPDMRIDLGGMLVNAGLENVNGAGHVFRLPERDSVSQTQRSRRSTLTETHGISARSAVMTLLFPDIGVEENSAWRLSKDQNRQIAVVADLVPVNYLGRFNVPSTPDQVLFVKNAVRHLDLDTLYQLLGVAADSADARSLESSYRALLAAWDANTQDATVLPTGPNAEFGTGSIIPLYDSHTQTVLLYRHGHKMPSATEVREQAAASGGFAIARRGLNENHTTHTGKVSQWISDNQHGLRLELFVPLQEYLDKIQFERSGMKYTVVEADRKQLPLPKQGFFRGWAPDLAASWHDTQSKQAFDGLVNNMRNAIAFLGMDFSDELAATLLGVDLVSLRETMRTGATAAERTAAAEEVALNESLLNTMLQDYANTTRKQSAAQADRVLRLVDYTDALTDMLGQIPSVAAGVENRIDSPAGRITFGILTALTVPGMRPGMLRRSGGFGNADSRDSRDMSILMPQLFTGYLDRAELGSDLRNHLFSKLNAQIEKPAQDGDGSYFLRQDWTLVVRAGGQQHEGWLQFAEAHSSGDNPVLNGMAIDRSQTQQYSYHTAATAAQAIGARTITTKELVKSGRFADAAAVSKWDDGDSLWKLFSDIPRQPQQPSITHLEQQYRALAYQVVGTFRKKLSTKEWTEGQPEKYAEVRNRVAQKYNLSEAQAVYVDYWVRQMSGKPLSPDGSAGNIGFAEALEYLREIEQNALGHFLPTYGAEVPQLHADDLAMLWEANKDDGAWYLVDAPKGARVTEWADAVNVALGLGDLGKQFDSVYATANDGLMHTYMGLDDILVGLPISRDMLKAAGLTDTGNDERIVSSFDPNKNVLLTTINQLEQRTITLEDLFHNQAHAQVAPDSVLARNRERRRKWRKENGIPEPVEMTMRNFRKQGSQFVKESTRANALLRTISNLRVANALINPALYTSAVFETMWRGGIEDVTNLLTGSALGTAARAGQAALERTPEALRQTAENLFGPSRFTLDDMNQLKQLSQNISKWPEFRQMIYKELMYVQPPMEGVGAIERFSAKLARIGAYNQDPTFGQPPQVLARRYVESVMQYMAATPGFQQVTPQYLAAAMRSDPTWVSKNLPDAHKAALATIANVRSLKQTPISLALRGIYEPLSENPNMLVAFPSTLFIRLPLMFSGYALNVATNITGMQGWTSALAFALHGRKNPFSKMQAFLRGEKLPEGGDPVLFDMSSVIESADLSKAFVQSGVTLTGLFLGGMLAGGLGLTGDDEEERRRRRAAQLQGRGDIYDPRELENDFRNADALFLDQLPFGLGSLFTSLGWATQNEDGRQIAHMHWMMKQFVSPILGMERFFQTGDVRQIQWGFADALGSFPLINQAMWSDANEVAAQLYSSAKDAEAEGTDVGAVTAMDMFTKITMTYERMLFENSFVNQLYVGYDDYDRDPWVIPLRDSDGTIQRDSNADARPGEALVSFVGEDGQVHQGYRKYDDETASARGFAENRLSYALFRTLVGGMDDSWLRQNMPIKMRTIEKPDVSQDQAENLVLQLLDNQSPELMSTVDESGSEVLTYEGARAIANSLFKGSVQLGDPALEGIYISSDTRNAIQKEWIAELIQEGIDAGLGTTQATARMNKLWYGPKDNPEVLGIRDILWSDQIPYTQNLHYKQLNTTYTPGPDGRMWATGVTRDKVLTSLGLQPLTRYYGGDSRLNTTDSVNVLNTGMRGLEIQDESELVPTDEEIGKSIEDAIKDATQALQDALNDSTGRGNYYNGYGGSRSSYSSVPNYGGSAQRLNTPNRINEPYALSGRDVYPNNPIIRRATVRRERFSSERGRLFQWQ